MAECIYLKVETLALIFFSIYLFFLVEKLLSFRLKSESRCPEGIFLSDFWEWEEMVVLKFDSIFASVLALVRYSTGCDVKHQASSSSAPLKINLLLLKGKGPCLVEGRGFGTNTLCPFPFWDCTAPQVLDMAADATAEFWHRWSWAHTVRHYGWGQF